MTQSDEFGIILSYPGTGNLLPFPTSDDDRTCTPDTHPSSHPLIFLAAIPIVPIQTRIGTNRGRPQPGDPRRLALLTGRCPPEQTWTRTGDASKVRLLGRPRRHRLSF